MIYSIGAIFYDLERPLTQISTGTPLFDF